MDQFRSRLGGLQNEAESQLENSTSYPMVKFRATM
jgi:hypothetical protein